MMGRYVVAGTDTGLGKTLFSAALAAHLRAAYWKPVQAGLAQETDSQAVARLTSGQVTVLPEAFRLHTPCSPHEAARIDGTRITAADLSLPDHAGPLVIEGAGGVLSPLALDLVPADLFARWGLPVVLVARTALGTINHSLLSIEALRSRGVRLAGVVFSGEAEPASEHAIGTLGQCRHLGRLPWLERPDAASLAAAFAAHVRADLLP